MAQKYYNVKETAEVLGVSEDDVKQMTEHRELPGYRDGGQWKFKVEDIDTMAKERQSQTAVPEDESGDVLMSEVELGQSDIAVSGTVIGMETAERSPSESDIRLVNDNSMKLADEPKADEPPKKEKEEVDSKVAQFEDLNLLLDEDVSLDDSSIGLSVSGDDSSASSASSGNSELDLAGSSNKLGDSDLVLGGRDMDSDVMNGGDTGISLLDPADSGISLEAAPDLSVGDDESLSLGEEDLLTVGGSVKTGIRKRVPTDEEFMLTPLEEPGDTDESTSSSQVIALDTEGDESATMISGAAAGRSRLGIPPEDLAGLRPVVDMVTGAPVAVAAAVGLQPQALAAGAPLLPQMAILPEAPYTSKQIAGLVTCVLFLMLGGMMIFDLMRNMWSWDNAFTVNSSLMDLILGLFEK